MSKRKLTLSSYARSVCFLLTVTVLCGLAPSAEKPAVVQIEEETIRVYVRTSKVIGSPWPVTRLSVTDPEIANVKTLTPDRVLLQGIKVGKTDLILWNQQEEVWKAKVEVVPDVTQLRADLAKILPGCRLDVILSGETVTVTGLLARAEQARQLRQFLGTTGLKYVDATRVAGVHQVQIQVRLAEVSRTAIRALGINAFKTGHDMFAGSTVGSWGGTAINPISIGPAAGVNAAQASIPFAFTSAAPVGQSVTLFAGFPAWGLELFLQALAENQYMRILAEPTLVALSGEEASFLAGGEFPVPVAQGTGDDQSITIQYRDYGVRLNFKPTVLGDGLIRLYVAPEVSETSDVVSIAGYEVPTIVTRRVETTLEMRSGQTFSMAGLISRTNTARTSRVPGLGDLPVLGALFRSVRYTKKETELVVLVTATLVEPLSITGSRPLPGALHTPPDDWELYAEGRIEGKAPPRISPADAARLKEMGLDRLVGPGAWATYDSSVAPSQATAPPPMTQKIPITPQPASKPSGK